METSTILPAANYITQAAQQRDMGSKESIKASDFLKLLITQLTNQNPLDPMDDKAFMAQMAQFSSLEEMSSLNKTMTNFVNSQMAISATQQAAAASAYLGRDVTILDENGDKVEGEVTAIHMNENGESQVTVDGKLYDTKQIQIVRLAK